MPINEKFYFTGLYFSTSKAKLEEQTGICEAELTISL